MNGFLETLNYKHKNNNINNINYVKHFKTIVYN